MKPPRTILNRLYVRLLVRRLSVDEMLNVAKGARSIGNLWLADQLRWQVWGEHPYDPGIVAQYADVLRDFGLPDEALRITTRFVGGSYAPIFTTRAAALCDLGRWEDAKYEVDYAVAIGGDDEAFAVVRRIREARPDLYPG